MTSLADGTALVAGGDRILWNGGKTIRMCSPAGGGCTGFPAGLPGPVNLDPAWSPSQEPTLAFVHGTANWPGDWTQQNIAAWYATRRLWVYVEGGNPHPVTAAGTGVADPVWSADGNFLLYVRGNSLWLIDPWTISGQPAPAAVRVVSRLFAGSWPQYYGYVNWSFQFARYN